MVGHLLEVRIDFTSIVRNLLIQFIKIYSEIIGEVLQDFS